MSKPASSVDIPSPQILLVEGESRDGQWLCTAFRQTGLLAISQVVTTAGHALACLRGQPPFEDAVRPSLVILDLCLPETLDRASLSTEIELLTEMKSDEDLRGIPVVIVTDSNAEADVLKAYSHGACSFVCKPNSESERKTLIERFARYWSEVARLPTKSGPHTNNHTSILSEPKLTESDTDARPVEILIVDDSEDDILLLEEAFADCPLVTIVKAVECGEQALSYLRGESPFQGRRSPGLVLMDINMPRQTGFEALMEIRADKSLARVPVVLLTSSQQESDILAAYTNGACSFISKPVSFDRLREVAGHFALYWALVANVPDGQS